MDSSCIDFVMFNSRGQHEESNMSRLSWKRVRDEDEELANCLVLLSNSGNAYNNKEKDKTVKKRKTGHVFQCKGCKKVFASHQALGGHRASHKKVKGCFATQDKEEEEEYKEEDDDEEEEEEEEEEEKPHISTRKKTNAHECTICHRVFSSGQALGGHKRCHWLTTPSTNYLRMTTLNDDSSTRHHHHHSQPLEPSLDLNFCQEYSVDPTTVMSVGRDGGGNNHNANSWLKLASGDWS